MDGPRVVALERIVWAIRTRVQVWNGLTGALGGGDTGPGGPGAGGPKPPKPPTIPPGPWWPPNSGWGWGGGLTADQLLEILRLWNLDALSLDPFDVELYPYDPPDLPIIPVSGGGTTTLVCYIDGLPYGVGPQYGVPGASVAVKDYSSGTTLDTVTSASDGAVNAAIGSHTDLDVTISSAAAGYSTPVTFRVGSSPFADIGMGGILNLLCWIGPYWGDNTTSNPVSLIGRSITFTNGSVTIANNFQTVVNFDNTVVVGTWDHSGSTYQFNLGQNQNEDGTMGSPIISIQKIGGGHEIGTISTYSLSAGTLSATFSTFSADLGGSGNVTI